MAHIGNRPPTDLLVCCDACGFRYWHADRVVFDGWNGPECPSCVDWGVYSDAYKSEVGIRPRFETTTAERSAYLRSVGIKPAVDYIEAVR